MEKLLLEGPDPEMALVRRRYQKLLSRYGALVEKYHAAVAERSFLYQLSWWIFDACSIGLALVKDGQLVRQNRGWFLLSGRRFPRKWLPADSAAETIELSGTLLRDIALGETQRLLESGEVNCCREFLCPEDGSCVELRLSVARSPSIVLVVAQDVTDRLRVQKERLRAQEAIAEQERLRALANLGEISAMVAHEVRNPLGVIFNLISALQREAAPTGNAAPLLQMLEEEATRINRIVEDLLAFGRTGAPTLQRCNLSELVSEAVRLATIETPSHAEVTLKLSSPTLLAEVDPQLFQQVVLNLVKNARQATAGGGAITVALTREGEGAGERIRLTVSDDGPGIPPAMSERVFDPFFSTKSFGAGLGLAIVRRIVLAHRGEVQVACSGDGGASFEIRLPASTRTQEGEWVLPATPKERREDAPLERPLTLSLSVNNLER